MKRISLALGLTTLLSLLLGCPSAVTPKENTYSVSYDGNGATSGLVPTDNQKHVLGSIISIPENTGSLVKTGYSFKGWNLKADGSGNSYAPGAALFMPAADIILYASWEKNPSLVSTYSLTYDGNGATSGTVPIDAESYKAGDITQVQNNSGLLARAGYYFVGWSTKSDGSGFDYSPGATLIMPAENLTLHAIWTATTSATATFSVTYVGNGATGSPPEDLNSYHQYDSILVSSSQGSMVKPGYILAGWMTSDDGTGTSYAQGARFSMGAANITLSAIWIPSTLTFTATETRITLTGFASQPSGAWSIPVGVTNVGPLDGVFTTSGTFANCISLTSITFPPSVVSIAPAAFSGCTSLTSLSFPAGLTSIGTRAFYGCTGLTSVSLPAGLRSIHPQAFNGCSNLATVTVDATNVNYATDSGVLYDKTFTNLIFAPAKITGSITIPSTVRSIAESAFSGCISLTGISLPAGLTFIGSSAFYGCTSLAEVSIPAGVTTLNNSTFSGCTGLVTATLTSGLTTIGSTVFLGCTILSNLTIPSTVSSIGTNAFQSCKALTSVTIPNGITTLKAGTFIGCTGLTSLTLPNSLTVMEGSSVKNCTSLTNITLPPNLTSIGSYVFSDNTGLTAIDIPATVTTMADYIFFNCTNLAAVTVRATTPPTGITSATFNSTSASLQIAVPAASVTAYQAASGWSSYSAKIISL